MRAFIAIEPGEACREALRARVARLAERDTAGAVRWVEPGNLHLTLRFLGDIDAKEVDALRDSLAQSLRNEPPVSSPIDAPVPFPNARRARVIAAVPRAPHAILALAARTERAVRAAGFASEERAFRAHVTLGRVRRGRTLGTLLEPARPVPDLAADTVVLFRSDLEPTGARYTPLARFPLGAPTSPPAPERRSNTAR